MRLPCPEATRLRLLSRWFCAQAVRKGYLLRFLSATYYTSTDDAFYTITTGYFIVAFLVANVIFTHCIVTESVILARSDNASLC
jgi:hypothetical protein